MNVGQICKWVSEVKKKRYDGETKPGERKVNGWICDSSLSYIATGPGQTRLHWLHKRSKME